MAEHQRIDVALLVDGGAGDVALVVAVDTDATVAQLLTAVGARTSMAGDGDSTWRLARTGETLEGDQLVGSLQLRHGDHLVGVPTTGPTTGPTTTPTGPPGQSEPASWQLRVVGGPDAGRTFALPPGATTVGGTDRADIHLPDRSLSSVHARLDVSADGVFIADAGSTNGTLVDRRPIGERGVPFGPGALAELGRCLLAVEPAPTATGPHPPYRAGQLLFHRPPRVVPADDETVVVIPSPPDARSTRRIPLATALIPLIIGLVIAAAAQNAVFLAIVLFAPVVAVASVVSDRRSGRSAHMKEMAEYQARFQQAKDLATELQARSVVARRKASPDPAELADRAQRADPRLWERRMTDVDFLTLRVGMADRPTRVRFETGEPPGEEAGQLRRAHADDVDVPAVVGLRRDILGVAGPEGARDAIARALVLQAVCLHSPRDVAIVALVPDEALERWRFLQWLPHTETLIPGTRTVAAEKEHCQALLATVDDLVAARRADTEQGPGTGGRRFAPHVLVLVAGDVAVSGPVLSRVLGAGPEVGVTAIVLADGNGRLPRECTFVASFAGGPLVVVSEMSLEATATGHSVQPVIPDLTPEAVLADVALALAPLRDIATKAGGSELPTEALLLDLIELTDPNGKEITARWGRSAGGIPAAIGVSGMARQLIDLRRDGPHALVAGAAGAGKSELLQTLVASLAVAHPPRRLTFVLVDHQGGTAFKDCANLPHVVGRFTDLDGRLAERALESLNTELRRREAILRSAGAKDLLDLEERAPADAPARLVIVVDEYSLLKKELPEFVDGLAQIAERGGSLGIHLVLGTQGPAGVVDDKIQADVTLRIALRVDDHIDSTQVLGRPDAARIPKRLPGRGYLRIGADEVTPVQTAYVSARRSRGEGPPQVDARPFLFSPMPPRRLSDPAGPVDAPTDLQRVVAAIGDAARLADEPVPPPWLD